MLRRLGILELQHPGSEGGRYFIYTPRKSIYLRSGNGFPRTDFIWGDDESIWGGAAGTRGAPSDHRGGPAYTGGERKNRYFPDVAAAMKAATSRLSFSRSTLRTYIM